MKNLKLLLPYIKKYKRKLILGFFFVTISNIAAAYAPRLIGETIDIISRKNFVMSEVYLNIGYILLLTFISGAFMMLTRRQIIVASREIEYDLRSDLFRSFQTQSMGFFNKNSSGSLMAHATNDIPAARDFLGPAIMYSANTITMFTFALYFMLSLDVQITIVGLIPLPLIAITTYIIGRKIHKAFKGVQEGFADLTTQAQESISGMKVIRAYVREFHEHTLFSNLSRIYSNRYLRLSRLEALMMPLLMVLVGFSQIAVLGFGGWKVTQGAATLGDLAQFFIYMNLLIWPVAAIGWITNIIQRASASSGRLLALMSKKPDIEEDADTDESLTNIAGHIEFKNVTMKYQGAESNALEKVSFDLKKGSTLGIVGTVGAGKTSIINLVPRLFDISEGEILIDGKNIKHYPLKTIRSAIGTVPQEPFLFSASIEDNISFSKPGASEEEILQASRQAMLHEEVLTFEHGYDTMLGERGVTLSGGQKQRLAIARAILRNPEILILDDALSAVDTQTEDRVLTELRKIMKNRTTIIISHRISTVQGADKIIVLDHGRIVEQGTHEQLITRGGKYFETYSRQQLEEEISKY